VADDADSRVCVQTYYVPRAVRRILAAQVHVQFLRDAADHVGQDDRFGLAAKVRDDQIRFASGQRSIRGKVG